MKSLVITALAAVATVTMADPTIPEASLSTFGERSGSSGGVEICKTCKPGSVLTCCQATFAGDLPTVQFLANLTGVQLDPRDVNCLGVRMDSFSDPSRCVGVKTCCDVLLPNIFTQGLGQPLTGIVTKLVNLLGIGVGIYCQGINQTCGTQYGQCGVYY